MPQRNRLNAATRAGLLIGIVLPLAGAFAGAPLTCLSDAASGTNTVPPAEAVAHIPLKTPFDNTLVQAELSRLGGLMVERGQVSPKAELLKLHVGHPLELPPPSDMQCEDVELAAKCKEAVVVVARLMRLGGSNAWMALPATGFFISRSGAFVTSSHVIHDKDYAGMVVLTGDGRVLPVRTVLADDRQCDVAILKAEGGPVSALPMERSAEAGTRVAVMSHPAGRFFTFTQGSVTRRSLQREGAYSQEVLEISAEFGPGSSGGPVLNFRGNVVGWVDTLRVWPGGATQGPSANPTLTFRECGVAADILRLVAESQVQSARGAATCGQRVDLAESRKPKTP